MMSEFRVRPLVDLSMDFRVENVELVMVQEVCW